MSGLGRGGWAVVDWEDKEVHQWQLQLHQRQTLQHSAEQQIFTKIVKIVRKFSVYRLSCHRELWGGEFSFLATRVRSWETSPAKKGMFSSTIKVLSKVQEHISYFFISTISNVLHISQRWPCQVQVMWHKRWIQGIWLMWQGCAQPGTITHIMHIERLIQRLPASFSLCPRNIDP